MLNRSGRQNMRGVLYYITRMCTLVKVMHVINLLVHYKHKAIQLPMVLWFIMYPYTYKINVRKDKQTDRIIFLFLAFLKGFYIYFLTCFQTESVLSWSRWLFFPRPAPQQPRQWRFPDHQPRWRLSQGCARLWRRGWRRFPDWSHVISEREMRNEKSNKQELFFHKIKQASLWHMTLKPGSFLYSCTCPCCQRIISLPECIHKTHGRNLTQSWVQIPFVRASLPQHVTGRVGKYNL